MFIKYMKIHPLLFIASFIFIMLFFYLISYNVLIGSFLHLEEEQNKKNLVILTSSFDKNLENLENSINDYSKWDDTYTFMKDENLSYIYENFRDGTSTLEDLNIDFIFFVNTRGSVLFSKYKPTLRYDSKKAFEIYLIEKFKDNKNESMIQSYENNYFYFVKSKISKSDNLKKSNGYILSGRIIKNSDLKKVNSIFEEVYIKNRFEKLKTITMRFDNKIKMDVNVTLNDESINNELQIFDKKGSFVLSLMAVNKRDIVHKGKNTIIIFNLVISVFLFIIFFIMYKNQKILEHYNKLLELKVNRRTTQLTKSFKKLQTKNKELHTLANKDFLTNISNRRSYFLKSKIALKQAIEQDSPLCILLMDIDNFKLLNDTYGHAVGDQVLIEFSKIVKGIIPETSIFGRIGGEEFCITFDNKDSELSYRFAENIRRCCEAYILQLDNCDIKFTVSFGLKEREGCETIDEILFYADELLYKAKERGRNCVVRSLHLP